MREEGLERVSAAEVEEVMETLLNCTNEELKSTSKEDSLPYLVRIIAKELLSNKRGWAVLNDVLDRAHGKAHHRQKAEDHFSSADKRTTITLPGGLSIDL